MDQQQQKIAAARRAAMLIEPGMRVGLGTGSTANAFVEALASRVRDGLEVTCAATSERTTKFARDLGLDVRPLEELGRLDIAVDGTDEVDARLRLIKGGGGAHLREKIVAEVADRFVVIADDSKLVDTLGAFPLPVEVVRFAWPVTAIRISRAVARHAEGSDATLRKVDGAPFVTDEGNYIIDVHTHAIRDPDALDDALDQIPGVVEHGLFIGFAERVLIGADREIAADGATRRVA